MAKPVKRGAVLNGRRDLKIQFRGELRFRECEPDRSFLIWAIFARCQKAISRRYFEVVRKPLTSRCNSVLRTENEFPQSRFLPSGPYRLHLPVHPWCSILPYRETLLRYHHQKRAASLSPPRLALE